MWYEYLTIPNIVFCIGLLILLIANCAIFMSFITGGWDGIGFGLLWYFIIVYAGFPLLWLYFKSYPPTTNNPKPKSKIGSLLLFLLINAVFIAQWLVWRYLLTLILN